MPVVDEMKVTALWDRMQEEIEALKGIGLGFLPRAQMRTLSPEGVALYSPEKRLIFLAEEMDDDIDPITALLHETAHALDKRNQDPEWPGGETWEERDARSHDETWQRICVDLMNRYEER